MGVPKCQNDIENQITGAFITYLLLRQEGTDGNGQKFTAPFTGGFLRNYRLLPGGRYAFEREKGDFRTLYDSLKRLFNYNVGQKANSGEILEWAINTFISDSHMVEQMRRYSSARTAYELLEAATTYFELCRPDVLNAQNGHSFNARFVEFYLRAYRKDENSNTFTICRDQGTYVGLHWRMQTHFKSLPPNVQALYGQDYVFYSIIALLDAHLLGNPEFKRRLLDAHFLRPSEIGQPADGFDKCYSENRLTEGSAQVSSFLKLVKKRPARRPAAAPHLRSKKQLKVRG